MSIGKKVILVAAIVCGGLHFICGREYHYEYPYEVLHDEPAVEKLVIRYTKMITNTCSSVFLRWLQWNDPIDIYSGICTASAAIKMYLCRDLLETEYFGFSFFMDNFRGFDCHHYKISLKHRNPQKLKVRSLFMFACPQLQYIDEETDETFVLPNVFFISRTHKSQSIFLYLQDDYNEPIYPHKFVSNVRREGISMFILNRMQELAIIGHIDRNPITETFSFIIEQRVMKFMRYRKLRNPYEKFTKFFGIINVCGLSRVAKIGLCRRFRPEKYYNFRVDYRGYDEDACRVRTIVSTQPIPEDGRGVYEMPTVKCPPFYQNHNHDRQFRLYTMFMSSSTGVNSVTMFHRLNMAGQQIKPDSLVSRLRKTFEQLEEHRRRVTEYLKPHYVEQQITDFNRLLAVESNNEKLFTPLFIKFDRGLVEDNAIEIVRITTMKNPYERFRRTFATITVNALEAEEMVFLCYQTLHHILYDFSFDKRLKNVEHVTRTSIQINLVMRDAELLPRETLRCRRCPPVLETTSEYFITSSVRTDAVVVYIRYDDEEYALPESLVYNIDKKALRTVRRNERLNF